MNIIKLNCSVSQTTNNCLSSNFDIKRIIRALKCRRFYPWCTILWRKPSVMSKLKLNFSCGKVSIYDKNLNIHFTLISICVCKLIMLLSFSRHGVGPRNSTFLKSDECFSMIHYPTAKIFVAICDHNLSFDLITFPMQFVLSLFQ